MMMTNETDLRNPNFLQIHSQIDLLAQSIGQKVVEGDPLHQIESSIWSGILSLGCSLMQHVFTLVGTGDMGPTVDLPNGQTVNRLPLLHPKTYHSIFGKFEILRTAYGTREGQKLEFVPLDQRLQLPPNAYSFLLEDWTQFLAVETSFEQANKTLEKILKHGQSVSVLERINGRMAQEVEAFRELRVMPKPEEEGELMVTTADGKGVVTRREADDQPNPAHRSKGDKASKKAMAIVGSVYTVDRFVRTPEAVLAALFREGEKPEEKRPEPCGKQVIANLTLEIPKEGFQRGMDATYEWLRDESIERNRGFVKETIHLCDGEEKLWETRERLLPRRVNMADVLDLLHVTPRMWQAAHLFYGEKGVEVEDFVRERILRILQGKSSLVVRGLREMGTKQGLVGEKKKKLEKICQYLEKNRERMRYDEYLAKGYPIASGVIEGACRHLVRDRMERAGMHWTKEGAQAMLDVRSIHVNGDWDEFQKFRVERIINRIYTYRNMVEGDKFRLAV